MSYTTAYRIQIIITYNDIHLQPLENHFEFAEALQVHWESAHGNDFGGSVGTVHVTPAKKQPR